jgi:hypothetical protein
LLEQAADVHELAAARRNIMPAKMNPVKKQLMQWRVHCRQE